MSIDIHLQNEAFLKSMGESYAKGIAVYLNLPRRAVPNPSPTPTPTPNPSPSEPGTKTYTIKQGDTLYSIAQKYGITVQALQEANKGLSDPLTLQVGKTIVIPSGTSPTPTPTPPSEQYPLPNGILKQGDSGEAVKQLQKALNAVNFKVGPVDGIYGVQTKDAVRRFQLVYLPYDVDGIYGPQTKNKLAAVLKAKS